MLFCCVLFCFVLICVVLLFFIHDRMFLDACEMGDDGGSNCAYGPNETDMNHHCSKGFGVPW